ncbi:Ig domain protein group 1 domain protein [Pantoea sp. BAV 3049]|uniref:Ig domain protein group 1 domain protein n=1 Tax=Pantoea sp. BAV 3049 TaxID=2654188 RepID=UPI00131D184C|nr:Ig domain protein group 1 domain protein [Pantoea sp. BAV 3049]
MTKLLNWLKGLFIHSKETNTMTDTVVEVPAVSTATTEKPTVATTPAEEAKAGVADFEAALAFVESGVAQLGEAAKDELKALAVKYL